MPTFEFITVTIRYNHISHYGHPKLTVSVTNEPMMTSLNGNIFRVTGHLCGEFTGPRWLPCTKASDAELFCFLWCAWINRWVNYGKVGDLRRHRTHYDVIVINSHRFRSVSIRPPIAEIRLFQNFDLTSKMQGQWHVFDHIVGSAPDRFISLSFQINWPYDSWDTAISKFDLENVRSMSWPRSKLMVIFEVYISIDMFAFRLNALGLLFGKIHQIYMAMKILCQWIMSSPWYAAMWRIYELWNKLFLSLATEKQILQILRQIVQKCPFPIARWDQWRINLITIGSSNSLSPFQPQAISWTNAGLLLIAILGTNFFQENT